MNRPAPIPLNPDGVSALLTCAICLDFPLQPVTGGNCEHMFCRDCLLHDKNDGLDVCPCCRDSSTKLKPLQVGALLYRIWSEVPVKCGRYGHGCAWTGCAVDAGDHARECSVVTSPTKQEGKLGQVTSNDKKSNGVFHCRKVPCDRLVHQLEAAKLEIDAKTKENQALCAKNDDLTEQVATLRACLDFKLVNNIFQEIRIKNDAAWRAKLNGGAAHVIPSDWNRPSIVTLTKLIAQYATCKPDIIDANEVFDCVGAFNDALDDEKSAGLTVIHRINTRMLFLTCLSSKWFTAFQMEQIISWMVKQGWASLSSVALH
ncbi:hypothetical protein MPSEU_001076600 [Mayamaea pseudoterrestris]|nr:hypothetical protein MPSEU_001076600 [Mayamaea pseudoterrestris]